jgi:hypothetical protein
MRYGMGEYASQEMIDFEARLIFIRTLNTKAPQVAQALFDQVLPVYRKDYPENKPSWRRSLNIKPDSETALIDWMDRFYLNEKWMRDCALGTLRMWADNPKMKNRELIIDPYSAEWNPEQFVTTWQPLEETITKAKERIEDELDRYLAHIEKLAEKQGWKKNKQLRQKMTGDFLHHFEWLVMYQVEGLSYPEIAEKYMSLNPDKPLTENTVNKGVVRVSDEIGLKRRKGRPGRPSKSKKLT